MPQVSNYTALLSGTSVNGTEGRGAFLTYSFQAAPSDYLRQRYADAGLATFQPFSPAYQQVARNALNAYASVSGLTLFEVPSGQGDIQFGEYDLAALGTPSSGFAFYPDDGSESPIASDVFIDKGSTSNDTNDYLLLHELGHAFGLKHAFEGDVTLAPEVDNATNSVLSSQYIRGFTGNLGIFDVQAVQFLYGGADQDGRQVASWSWDAATFTLTQTGDGGDNAIFGVGTRDVISGGDGADRVLGRAGDDVIDGGGGDDQIFGGLGADRLTGGEGADRVEGGDGNDAIAGGAGRDTVFGLAGDDMLDGGAGDDELYGGAGADRLTGGDGTDRLQGGDGNDILTDNGNGDNILFGEAGDDVLTGGTGRDFLSGGIGNDRLFDIAGSDVIDGGPGVDSLFYGQLTHLYGIDTRRAAKTFVFNGETDMVTAIESIAFRDATLTFDPDSTAAQVLRLYRTVLDRLPDPAGLDAWTDALAEGRSLVEVARAFLAAPEFQRATGALSNGNFVEYLYVHALGRASDPGGKAAWVAALDGGAERAGVLLSFSESAEQRGLTASRLEAGLYLTDDTYQEVAALYDSFAGRLPDAPGLVYWADQIKSGALTLAQVAEGFAGSAEFQGRTAGLGNEAFVDYLYRNTLDRGADPGGQAAWSAALAGGASRGQVLLGFSSSDEHFVLIQNQIDFGIDLLV